MRHVAAPVVAPGLDAQAHEVGVHLARAAQRVGLGGLLAGAEQQLTLVVHGHVGVFERHLRQEGVGRVVIEGGVHPVAEVAARVIAAGEADAALEEVRATQQRDGGVGGAHVAAHGQRAGGGLAHLVDEGHELVDHVVIVGLLATGALLGVAVSGPGLLVHGLGAEELDDAGVEVLGELVDHARVLEALRRGGQRREHHDGQALLAIYVDVHVLAENGAPAHDAFLVHMIPQDVFPRCFPRKCISHLIAFS